ncbi:male sterility protein [Sarocladium implicatum]|nr:male sterility protein [Sarocladium implicatum]
MTALNSVSRDEQSQHPIHLLEQRARNGHVRPFAIFPKSKDFSLGFTEVSYELLANAVNRVAWWLEKVTDGPKPGTILSWSGPSDFRYAVLLLACMKCRYNLLLPSPRNSEEYQRTIFKVSGCQFACGPKTALAKLRKPLDGLKVCLVEGMTLEQILDPSPVPVYPFNFTFEEVKRDTPLVLHTSGSTGENTAAGSMMNVVWPLICDLAVVWGSSDRPLNGSVVEGLIEHTKPECAMLPPSIVDDMAKTSSGIAALSTLESVVFGGGPLQKATGDKVSKVTRLFSVYGSTETLLLPQLLPGREDWAYMELDPQVGYVFQHVQEDLYHLIVRRTPEYAPIQPVFLLMPQLDEYSTGDLVSPHPTKPNLWSVKGRADDLIILSSGEKFDPAPGEAVVRKSPLVRNCLLVGRGRPQALLLIERNPDTTKSMSTQELSEALWPVVEEMNKSMATQAHITPDHMLLAPPGVEFPMTPKGTLRRRATEDMFMKELQMASGGANNHNTKSHNGNHITKNGAHARQRSGDIGQAVREIICSICGVTDIGDDEDLFEYGLDSIQAQQISATLKRFSDLWPNDSSTATNLIYSNPTIKGLTDVVTANSHQNGDREVAVETLIEKYTSDLPRPRPSSEPMQGYTVAITGSTGNLGCHILNDLIQHPDVVKVICLNRATGGKEAQDAAFHRNRVTQAYVGDTIVSHYKVDLSDPFLGLTPTQYSTLLREADVLIHNAWQLDFLRRVKAFEKTHIAGVRYLVDLAASSLRDMRIVFISSIGAVAGTNPSTFAAVPEAILPGIQAGHNGYSEGKFVAERIVQEAAQQSHVKSAIVRVGQIAGPYGETTGTWSTTDWFPRIIASAAILRAVPDSLGLSDAVDWLPINAVSQVVTDITESTWNTTDLDTKVFHVVNPREIAWNDLAPVVAGYLGHDVRLVSLSDWISEVEEAVRAQGSGVVPVEALLPWLKQISGKGQMARLAVDKTMAMSSALASPGPIQASWVKRWMADWLPESVPMTT